MRAPRLTLRIVPAHGRAGMNIVVEPAPNPTVAVGNDALRQCAAAGADRRAVRSSKAARMRWRWRPRCKEIAARLGIGLVYKTSFDKANRTSAQERPRHRARRRAADLRRDPRDARRRRCSPTCTSASNARASREVVDVLQIPAFLCRQTDLLVAAAADRPRRQRQEGPVPGALGHGERGRQDHRRRQSATCW